MFEDRPVPASGPEAGAPKAHRRRLLTLAFATAILMVSGGRPLAAEWLVLKDGREIETKGAWTVDGRRITFTAMNGTFSAIRTETVDLEKSRERNEPAPAAVEPPAKVKEPGLVIRQSDIGTTRLPDRSTGEEVEAPQDEAGRIAVVEWDEVVVPSGTRIEGRLRNDTESTYLALVVTAELLDDNGQELAQARAKLEKNWIGRGEILRFRADFENVIAFDTVRFEVDGQAMGRVTDNSLVTQDRPGQEPDAQADDTADPPR